jgi:Protein of unknown function (DUF5132)
MAFVEDMFKGGNVMTGLAVGLGAAVVAPVVLPVLRPIMKSVIKAGLIAYDEGRNALVELNERTGDIVGEARSEMTRSRGERTGSESTDQAAIQRDRARRSGRPESPTPASA